MTVEKKKELVKRLKQIWDDRDFVCGAMSNAGSEKAWQVMLEYIEEAERLGRTVTSDEILLLSLDLGEEFDNNRISSTGRKIAAAMF